MGDIAVFRSYNWPDKAADIWRWSNEAIKTREPVLPKILFWFSGETLCIIYFIQPARLTDQCFQHKKGVSLESRYEGTKIFTPCPQKIGFWAQKRPNLAQNWHFGPNIGIFGPFDLMPRHGICQKFYTPRFSG